MDYKYKIITLLIYLSFSFSQVEKLNILNFNIHGFGSKKITKKVNSIINKIKDFDIIFIQENWVHKKLFKNELFNHTIISSNKKNKTIYNSGLTIGVNKSFNVIENEEILFEQCNGFIFNGSDCFASKGIIYSRLNNYESNIDIYNTHLDSGNSKKDMLVREQQLDFLTDYITKKSAGQSLIICGDFNINYKKNANLINNFINDLNLKSHSNINSNTVDYIFFRDSNDLLLEVKEENMKIDSLAHLSDHAPLSILFNLLKDKRN